MSSGLSWTVPSLRLWTITGTPSRRENKHWLKNNPAKKGLSSCTMLILHSTTTEESVRKNYCIDSSASSVAMVNFNIGGDTWVVEWATTWTWDCMIAWMHHWEVSDCMKAWLHECITGRCLTAWKHDCMNASLGGVWLHQSVKASVGDRECMIGECVTVSMLNWGPVYANIFNIFFLFD